MKNWQGTPALFGGYQIDCQPSYGGGPLCSGLGDTRSGNFIENSVGWDPMKKATTVSTSTTMKATAAQRNWYSIVMVLLRAGNHMNGGRIWVRTTKKTPTTTHMHTVEEFSM